MLRLSSRLDSTLQAHIVAGGVWDALRGLTLSTPEAKREGANTLVRGCSRSVSDAGALANAPHSLSDSSSWQSAVEVSTCQRKLSSWLRVSKQDS